MHADGWLHQSVYPRNVLMQPGDITDRPIGRTWKNPRFRLIDFGRSQYTLGEDDKNFPLLRAAEEWSAQLMYGILNASGWNASA